MFAQKCCVASKSASDFPVRIGWLCGGRSPAVRAVVLVQDAAGKLRHDVRGQLVAQKGCWICFVGREVPGVA